MAQAGAPFFGARVIALRRERVSRESVLGGTVRGSLAPHGAVVVAHRDREHLPQDIKQSSVWRGQATVSGYSVKKMHITVYILLLHWSRNFSSSK